jgi:DNA-binding transcriptional LysR family regulator
MLINQVRYFLAICQEGSFTRAARRCGVAQPTVTNAIRVLEREFGGALFDRKPPVALTALGQAVHPHLRRVVKATYLAHAAARKVDGERTTRSTISLRPPPAHDSDLVRADLATVPAERVAAGTRKMEVATVRITEAGRKALAGMKS